MKRVIVRIVACIVLFLIFVSLVRSTIVNGGSLSFTSFLNWLANFKPVDIRSFLIFSSNTIVDDWGILNFFRDFINGFINLLNVPSFLIGGFIILIQFILGVVTFIFAV